jgi:CubicO group peptidase (beta-lactamase class C family)
MPSTRTIRGGRLLPAPLPLLLLLLLPQAVPAQAGPLRGLDAYVERGMREWEVPGLAIAIVKDDAVVYARGFGVRELGGQDRVDENTVFAIGSASKAFTAAAVGMLVEEGKVAWDDAATRHLAGFQLFDPYATRELTVRDLLAHRSGLARGDQLWYATEFDRAEILRRVRYLEPSWSFRSQFGYQNLMYLAAGELVPAVHPGTSWDDFVRDRIFAPLGMRRSSTSTLALQGQPNVASPHARVDGRVRPIPYRNIDNIGPAGSINSSATEMAQWVRLQLGEGTYAGRKLLESATVREMHTPHTVIRREGSWAMMSPASNFMTYGLGWFLQDYRGRMVVQHGGNIDGMHALVSMMPEERLGMVILTNLPNSLTSALAHRVFDLYLGRDGGAAPRDWSAILLARRDSLAREAQAQQRRFEESRVTGTTPSLALDRYAGTYQDDMFGDVVVALEEGRLVARRGPAFVGDLEHWHHDTFRIAWRDATRGHGFATFALDARARVVTLDMQGLATFARVSEPTR